MKTYIKSLYMLLAAVACISIGACSSDNGIVDEPVPVTPADDDTVVLTIGFSGDIEVTDLPLTRALADDDLCAIVVKENGANFAYGLFETSTVTGGKLTLTAKKSNTYTFEATVVRGGKTAVAKSGEKYGLPLNAAADTNFVLSEADAPFSLTGGRAELTTGVYDHPAIQRFYGSIDYTPSEDAALNIPVKLAGYGIQFTTENFTEGTLMISIEGSPDITLTYDATATNPTSPSTASTIYSFKDLSGYSATDGYGSYSETVGISVVWTKADGTRTTLANAKPVELGNKAYTIHVNVGGEPANGAVAVQEPTTEPMDDGNDDPVTIPTGQITITD